MRRAIAVTALAALMACSAGHAAEAPWWAAYADPALDQMMHGARSAEPAAQQMLVQAWIVARVQRTRLALVQQLLGAARAEQALLMNAESSPERDSALAGIAHRVEQVEQRIATLEKDRDERTGALARQTGVPAEDLQRWLEPGSGSAVPQVAVSLPADEGDEDGRRLAAQARETQRLRQLQQARQYELQAHQVREQAGAGDRLRTLETFQQLMLDTDRVAVSAGELALAWSQWLPAGRR